MRNWLEKKIKAKLSGYKVALNSPDLTLPTRPAQTVRVAVVGGGIAGISAAANLAERGFKVDLFEKNEYPGGKLGSWTFESKGETLRVEHGFHAFFRQYHNLRNFMKKIGSYGHLVPIDDYVILFPSGEKQGFKGIDNTPGLNILSLRKTGVYNWRSFIDPRSAHLLSLLKYDPGKTFRDYDNMSYEEFARKTGLPRKMRVVFNSFARAFFAEPEKMSMAELIKGFHFYFLSSDDGLLYDVLDDDFDTTFLKPAINFIESHDGRVRMSSPVERMDMQDGKFVIGEESYDYCVLALDVKHVKQLVSNSQALAGSHLSRQVNDLKCADRYAVWRIWTDRLEMDVELPFFIFTDRLKCLDSITLYHRMEKESAHWSETNKGGIFELHCYSLPDDLLDDNEIKNNLLEELFHFLPELRGLNIMHEYFQHRDDFPAFHTGQYKSRPGVKTDIPNLFLAGDWVKIPSPAMLMEAAYTSGAMAANEIFSSEGLQEGLLQSVPGHGLLA